MKVLHINTERTWRGGERQTFWTVRELRNRGIDAQLVVRNAYPLHEKADSEGIPVIPIRPFAPWDPITVWNLVRRIRKSAFDLIHTQTSHALTLVSICKLFGLRIPVVASRRVDFPVNNAGKYNACDAVIAISSAIRGVLIDSGVDAKLIQVIPSGVETTEVDQLSVDTLRESLGLGGKTVFGTIGHLARHKGYDVLLNAWPEVYKAKPNARLVIVGEGEERSLLESLVEQHNISDSVRFAGFQEKPHMYLKMFDYFVQPSRTEGLGTTAIEAMMTGTPVIASRTGGLTEVLDDGKFGILVEPENSAKLARALIETTQDDKLLESARLFALNQFGLKAMVDKTLSLYEQLTTASLQ